MTYLDTSGFLREEVDWTFNAVYEPVFYTKARYIDIVGGRAAGRSHFGTEYFLFLLCQPQYFRGCFLRHVYGDIRDSLFADIKDRIEEKVDKGELNDEDFEINESKMTFLHRRTGNTIISKGFKKSAGNRSAKLKSLAGLTHVMVEEADENYESDVNKLDDSIRTNKIEDIQIIFLHNPPSKNHWIVKRFYNLEDTGIIGHDGKPIPYYRIKQKNNPDVLVIFSTYKDNLQNLNTKTLAKYHSYNDPDSPFFNEEQYYVDVEGMVPEGARGRIYKGWKHITKAFFKSLSYQSYYGLDFGYGDDPVALVEIKSHNNRNFYHEVIYETELTNPALAKLMSDRGVPKDALIFADSAEPKSIQELKDLGYKNVQPADKGPDSIDFGIKAIKALENYATEESVNLWKENEEYKWRLNDEGESTGKPIDKNNHLKDALRMANTTYKEIKRKKGTVKVADTREGKNKSTG
jgi:phage terminase large subunit